MEKIIEIKTKEELIELINELEGDFIIHIEKEGMEIDGGK